MKIKAIHPLTGKIEAATIIFDHFGKGRHSIRFKADGMNGANYLADNIEWEED